MFPTEPKRINKFSPPKIRSHYFPQQLSYPPQQAFLMKRNIEYKDRKSVLGSIRNQCRHDFANIQAVFTNPIVERVDDRQDCGEVRVIFLKSLIIGFSALFILYAALSVVLLV